MRIFHFHHWLAGLQWLFFFFANTVVIPITVGAAFKLQQGEVVALFQVSFLLTGFACIVQAMLGHGRSIMEGQSGLWWGVILSLAYAAPAQGLSLAAVGGSLAVGIVISGLLTIVIGLSGFSQQIAKLFNPGVMAVFTLLLGCRLNSIFLKGMLGIPFAAQVEDAHINIPVFLLASAVAGFVIFLSTRENPIWSKYSLLIGILVGWLAFELLFHETMKAPSGQSAGIILFPLGKPTFDSGIITTVIIAGLLNISNTFGALTGTDAIYKKSTTARQYKGSLIISGCSVMLSGLFGAVPYAPYVSSIGFLNQTKILDRLPFILGGGMMMLIGAIPAISSFMANLPLSVGGAVLFVVYLRLLHTALQYFSQIELNTANMYRLAIPLFVGIIFMTFPTSYFATVPSMLRPLVSNGLLMGILLSLLMENIRLKKNLHESGGAHHD